MVSKYSLAGYISPLEEHMGFLLPIFQKEQQYFVQNISDSGTIQRFSPFSPPAEQYIEKRETEKIEYFEGSPAVFSFAFPSDDIYTGRRSDIAKKLKGKLDELNEYPFIKSEVLEFLNIDPRQFPDLQVDINKRLGKTLEYLHYLEQASDGAPDLEYSPPVRAKRRDYERVSSELFIGREDEKKDFFRFLEDESGPRILSVHTAGEGGIGKTQFLLQMQKYCRQRKDILCGTKLIDFYHTDARTNIDIMQQIADNLVCDNFPDFRKKLSEFFEPHSSARFYARSLYDDFYREYEGLSRQNKITALFFDTYETVQGNDYSKWLETKFFPKLLELNPNTRIIIAGRKPLHLLDARRLLIRPFNIIETTKFLKKCFHAQDNETLQKKIGGHETIQKIQKLAGGRPIILSLFTDWFLYGNLMEPEEIIRELENKNKKTELFEKMLVERVLFLKQPEDKAVLNMALAYRRMTPEILNYLENISIEQSRNILFTNLKPLSFIKYKDDCVLLHDEMCKLVVIHCWEKADPEKLKRKKLAEKLAVFYDSNLLNNENVSQTEKAVYHAERLYYRLYADINKGFDEFIQLFDEYLYTYQTNFCDLIGNEVLSDEFYPRLSSTQRLSFILRRIRYWNEKYQWRKSIAVFSNNKPVEQDDTTFGPAGKALYDIQDKQLLTEFLAKTDKNEGEREMEAYFEYEYGIANHWLGRFKEALLHYRNSEKIFRTLKNDYEVAWVYNLLGYKWYKKGKFELGEAEFLKSLNGLIACLNKNHKIPKRYAYRISNVYSNINALYRHQGRFFEAAVCGQIAIAIARKKNDHREINRFLNAQGETYRNLNRTYEAELIYQEISRHLQDFPDPLLKARMLIGSISVAYRRPDYIHILKFYGKNKRDIIIGKFREIVPDVKRWFKDGGTTGDSGQITGMLKKAQSVLLNDLDERTAELADLYFYMAEAFSIHDAWNSALEYYQKSESIANDFNNEYRRIDAIVGQIMTYYFAGNGFEKSEYRIKELEIEVKNSSNPYPNLIGKMEIVLGNMAYDRFSETGEWDYLKQAVEKYLAASDQFYQLSRISYNRFYAIFQILAQRLSDIPPERFPSLDSAELLREIWVYNEKELQVCLNFSDILNEILDFFIQRIKYYHGSEELSSSIDHYYTRAAKCLENGRDELPLAPVYGIMRLQLCRDSRVYGYAPDLVQAYTDLGHSQLVNDNLFEARNNYGYALKCIPENEKQTLLYVRILIKTATSLYSRREFTELFQKYTKKLISSNLKKYYELNKEHIEKALDYFDEAESIMRLYKDNQESDKVFAHLQFRRAGCLLAKAGEFERIRSEQVENEYLKALNFAESAKDVDRQMSIIEALISYYYHSDQWDSKNEQIKNIGAQFEDLNIRNYSPSKVARIETIFGNVIFDKISSASTAEPLIEKAFMHYIVASRMGADYSYKLFYESVSVILDRIAELPKESVRILHRRLYPRLKKRRPIGDVAATAYKLVEQCLFLHSEVL